MQFLVRFSSRQRLAFNVLSLLVGLSCAASAVDFTVLKTADSGPGSLRQAILDANALPGADRIVFNIPGPGVHKIVVGIDAEPTQSPEPLPKITDPLTIDGFTQPGASPNTREVGNDAVILIRLHSEGNLPYREGLAVSAPNCTIRGLSLTGFGDNSPGAAGGAIGLRGPGGTRVEGNFIGLAPNGNTAFQGSIGVLIYSDKNVIGGLSPSQRNVIAGQFDGLRIIGYDNVVAGNYIGTNAAGTAARPNGQAINIDGRNLIGGVTRAAANVLSGNSSGGQIYSGVTVQGNFIGTQADGVHPLGNLGGGSFNPGIGLFVFGDHNVIGGLEPGAGNVIAYNAKAGVSLQPRPEVSSNPILSNLIYSNGTIPIDLNGDGTTFNDPGDGDDGPNHLQNSPVITSATREQDGSVTLRGVLQSAAATEFVVQFFHYAPKPLLLGTNTITTDANGDASFEVTFSDPAPMNARKLYGATATDPNNNTSEMMLTNGPVQLANLSTRGRVELGERILIGGFMIDSPNPKRLGFRALGPSLNVPDHLADPYLELYDKNGVLLAKNDDWRAGQQQEIIDSGLAPASDVESALITTLGAGAYTAQVHGANDVVGAGLMEIYDLDAFPASAGRLVNLSTRGLVEGGDNVLIGGFITRGANAQQLVVRAIGPDLGASGVSALPDPVLELHDRNGSVIASDDDWRDTQEAELTATGLAPKDERDSAILISLPPAAYTAIVRGKSEASGVALVEFYDLSH